MKKQLKVKNLVIASTISLLSICWFSYEHKYHPKFEIINDESQAYGKYRNGLVYIGDQEYLDSLSNINDNDVLVLDERVNDFDIKIYDSYLIKDKEERNDILNIISIYENSDPSIWDRSIESMRLEWFVHNFFYTFNYEVDRTKDVDFHNDEEDTYKSYILKQLLKL